MAITTMAGHVSRALDFYNKYQNGTLWFAIGQTDPWPDDTNPPTPSVNQTDVAEIIGFKKAASANLVINGGNAWASQTAYSQYQNVTCSGNVYQCTTAGTSGTVALSGTGTSITDGTVVWTYVTPASINYQNQLWGVVSTSQSVQYQTRGVQVQTTISGNELPLMTYRQIGIYTGLVMANGLPAGTTALLPNQVSSTGICEIIDNRKPVSRSIDQKETITIIAQF